jgi:hypothetical protein
MEFDIDVSGDDILNSNYSICVANNDGYILGFKFSSELIKILSAKLGQNLYKYKTSQKQKATFKLRLYSIVIYYLIKTSGVNQINLNICKDFSGRENDIKSNLDYFLVKLLGKEVTYHFTQLSNQSNAHRYSYLMRNDTKNQLKIYVKINLNDFEKFLLKK